MIESVCNGERACLETMQTRFPECLSKLDNLGFEKLFLVPIQKRFWENDFGTNKRALKLMNILMKVDRIPVG